MGRAYVVVASVVLAACGGGGGAGTDSGMTGDVLASDTIPSGPVTVVVTLDSQPLAGVRVFFQRADSSVITAVDTDASGMAQSDVPPEGGAWVSAVTPNPGGVKPLVQTIGGVKPGDTLRIAAPFDRPLLSLNMSLPKDSGATAYDLWSSCDDMPDGVSDAQTTAFTFVSRCTPPIDFMVVSNTGHFLHVAGQTPVNGRIDLTGTYAPMSTITGTYTNAPANTYWLWVQYRFASPGKRLYIASHLIDQFTNQAGSTPPLRMPTGTFALIADETTANALQSDRHHRLERVAAPGATRDVDAADLVYGFTGTPAYSAATGSIRWQAGLATGFDTVFCYFSHSRAGGSTTQWEHFVVEPHTQGQLVLPTLPVETFDYNITSGDAITVRLTQQIRSEGGNDALRGRLLSTGDIYEVLQDLQPGERRDYIEVQP